MHPTVFDGLAIDGHQWIGIGSQHLLLPGQHGGFDLQRRDTLQHPQNTRFAWHFVFLSLFIEPAMQGPALWPSQILGVAGNATITSYDSGHLRAGGNGQNGRDPMALSLALTKL